MEKNQPARGGKKPTPEQIEKFVDGLGVDADKSGSGDAIEAHRKSTTRDSSADATAAERLSGW